MILKSSMVDYIFGKACFLGRMRPKRRLLGVSIRVNYKPSQAEADSLSCEVDCFDHRQDNSPETELTRRSLGGLNLHVYLVNQAQLAVILASCLKVSIPVW